MMTFDNRIIAANIVHQRKKAGYQTQKDIADKMQISIVTYRKYESEPTSVPIYKLIDLAELFGCEVNSFFAA